ncbi:MAG: GAF domain-containing protein, partial [Bradymonadaceae bacterium]
SLIEDVFLEVQEIHEGSMSMEEVINYIMDMAVDKAHAESGAVLFADVNGQELYFATARGPKADEVMSFRVPMGKGIVGFCAREGVSLAIGDANRDPRFYKQISESLGYETKALICAPIQHEGRVYGAIELINKKGHNQFSSDEMNALSYIGRQLAKYVYDVIMAREKLD